MRHLHQAGIGTQVHYRPIHQQPFYCGRAGELELNGAESYYKKSIALPLHMGVSLDDVRLIAGRIK
jgi:dTDP-4-amino-4,6-dideoxygalactose transaminase